MSQHHFTLVIRETQTEVKLLLGWDRMLRQFELEIHDASLPPDEEDWTPEDAEKINYDSTYAPGPLKTVVHVEDALTGFGIHTLNYPLLTQVLKIVLLEKGGDQRTPLKRNIIERYTATARPRQLTKAEEARVRELLEIESVQYQLGS